MAEADPLRKYVEAGIAFTQLTKARAEAIVRDLVKAGEVQREQAQDRVEELLDRSRKSTEGLAGIVRREISQQLASLGFATKDDLDRLEARMETRLAAMAPESATPASKAPKAPKAAATTGAAAKKATRTPTATRVDMAPATPPAGSAARKASASPRRRTAGPADKA